jgi:hypothetical protein
MAQQELLQHVPPPVRAFVERRQGCNHWAGEEPYDEKRAKEIARAIDKLRCDRLDDDELDLRRRYARQPAALKLIRDSADWY